MYNNIEISGWLNASGTHLTGILPSGTLVYRTVNLPSGVQYTTGHTSTLGGSFKPSGMIGNWYGDSRALCDAERTPQSGAVFEVWRIEANVPVLDMTRLPSGIQQTIAGEKNFDAPEKFGTSQTIMAQLGVQTGISGTCFPSRRGDGNVLLLNPHLAPMTLNYTGYTPSEGIDPLLSSKT